MWYCAIYLLSKHQSIGAEPLGSAHDTQSVSSFQSKSLSIWKLFFLRLFFFSHDEHYQAWRLTVATDIWKWHWDIWMVFQCGCGFVFLLKYSMRKGCVLGIIIFLFQINFNVENQTLKINFYCHGKKLLLKNFDIHPLTDVRNIQWSPTKCYIND